MSRAAPVLQRGIVTVLQLFNISDLGGNLALCNLLVISKLLRMYICQKKRQFQFQFSYHTVAISSLQKKDHLGLFFY